MAGGLSTKSKTWDRSLQSLAMQRKAALCPLLRRPRAPPPPPPALPSPTPCSYTSEFIHDRYVTPHSQQQYLGDGCDSANTDGLPSDTCPVPVSSSMTSQNMVVPRDELKYVLDPFYRNKTSLGTYVEGRPLLQPLKPRGPDALPARVPRKWPEIMTCEFEEDLERYYQIPEFTLDDFALKVSEEEKLPLLQVQHIMFSKHSYRAIQKMLADICLSKQTTIHKINFSVADDAVGCRAAPRVPQQQLLIEMAAIVKKRISTLLQANMKAVIRPLPRFSDYKAFHVGGKAQPHTEILLYEDPAPAATDAELMYQRHAPHTITEHDLEQPLKFDDGLISLSDLAILHCLMNAGHALSLKAHFIAQLPDIQPISKNLTYLNLSFNNFRTIPFEVFFCDQLLVLKLRNNPIREISSEISQLHRLSMLVISFCLLTSLPQSLFELRQLEHLDFSYNRVSFIPNEIQRLENLSTLIIEGNLLGALPCGMLQMSKLTTLLLNNNYMHPYFWKDHSRNSPQRLVDLAALTVTQHHSAAAGALPDDVWDLINKPAVCDCCGGALYGPGLRFIRPATLMFGVRHLPFLFRSCSPRCMHRFKRDTGLLAQRLYASDGT